LPVFLQPDGVLFGLESFQSAHVHEEGKHALDLFDAVFRGLLSSSQARRLFLCGPCFEFRHPHVASNAINLLAQLGEEIQTALFGFVANGAGLFLLLGGGVKRCFQFLVDLKQSVTLCRGGWC
jgi:hypothetical protein